MIFVKKCEIVEWRMMEKGLLGEEWKGRNGRQGDRRAGENVQENLCGQSVCNASDEVRRRLMLCRKDLFLFDETQRCSL